MNNIKKYIPDKIRERLRPLSTIIYFFKGGKLKKLLSRILVRNTLQPEELNTPFFVVATRGNLHVIKLCLKYIPSDQECVVVLNGLERWERKWAYHHLKTKGFIIFPFLVDHSTVIDYLLSWLQQPFGLMDEDCFVFDRNCFARVKQLQEKTVISSYYFYQNGELGLAFPETIFLFMNTPVINGIRKQYRLDSSAKEWNELPSVARNKLLSIGISDKQLPEDYKPYFDTLRALMAISLAEDYQFYFPDGDHSLLADKIFHVGAVASVPLRGVRMQKWDAARGSYFWYRALEATDEIGIQKKYYEKYGYSRSEDLLNQLPDSLRGMFERNDYFSALERIVNSN